MRTKYYFNNIKLSRVAKTWNNKSGELLITLETLPINFLQFSVGDIK